MTNFEGEKEESKQIEEGCALHVKEKRGIREVSRRNNGNLQQLRNGAINNIYLIHGDD